MNRLLRFFGFAFIGMFLLPGACMGLSWLRAPGVAKQSVLHVVLDGPLPERARPTLRSLWSDHMHIGLHEMAETVRAAAHDGRIVGLLLDIRTGDLGLAQVGELRAALENFKKSKKPSLAYLQSGGELRGSDRAYALATAADRVILAPPSELSLSGLRAEVPFLKQTLARLHVQAFTEQRHEYKNFANTFSQDGFTHEHLSALKGVLDDLQITLLQMVADGRHTSLSQVRDWVLGAPWSAAAAQQHKLVDQLGYWDEVVTEAEKIAGRPQPLLDIDDYEARRSSSSGGTKVAYIVASGEIHAGDSGRSPIESTDKVGSDTLTQALRDARDGDAEAILLRIDSPGGSWVASDVIRREVELCHDANIPVVVSMGNVAASGGYLIATEADHIVVEPGSITGSIGVVAASFAVREALQHFLGVRIGVYETLPHPGSLNMLDPPTPADRSRIAQSLDRIYTAFVDRVAATRHRTHDEIHALAKGRIWSGRQAVKFGLADEEGGIHTALAHIRLRLALKDDAPLQLHVFPEPQSPFDVLRDYVSSEVRLRGELQALGTLLRGAGALVRQSWTQGEVQMPPVGL